jgi:hypothetical protein
MEMNVEVKSNVDLIEYINSRVLVSLTISEL